MTAPRPSTVTSDHDGGASSPTYAPSGPWLPLMSILVDIAARQQVSTAASADAADNALPAELEVGEPSARPPGTENRRETR